MYFSASWCGPCKMLAPKIAELAKEIVVEKIDVDSQPDVAEKFNITSVPTTIVVVDGIEKERQIGSAPIKVFLNMYNKY